MHDFVQQPEPGSIGGLFAAPSRMKSKSLAAKPRIQEPTSNFTTFLTPEEVATYLREPLETVRTWRKKRNKVGEQLRYDLPQVHQYLESAFRQLASAMMRTYGPPSLTRHTEAATK